MPPLLQHRIAALEADLRKYGLSERLGLHPVAPIPLPWPAATQAGVHIDLLPLDRLHPIIAGNKWFKLKYNLLHALQTGTQRVVSFGGAYSNHLHALAWAGHRLGLSTEAFIRGDDPASADTPTLADLRAWGMTLQPVSRTDYRALRASGWTLAVPARTLVLPEGGDNPLGVLGCASLADLIPARRYDQVHVACGTGCTLLGLRLGLPASVGMTGWSALKGDAVRQALRTRLPLWTPYQPAAWTLPASFVTLRDTAGLGRFGKQSATLQAFMTGFEADTGVLLDPVYTGRMLWGLHRLLRQGGIAAGTRLLIVHSGGLQGRRSG